MISLDQPLDLGSPDAQVFLSILQGNILKSHGRDHASHIFLRFGDDTQACCDWISSYAKSQVTSAARQAAQITAWKSSGGTGSLFASFLLSHAGYVKLGVPETDIPVEPNRTYFQQGLKNQALAERPFNDPPPAQWEAEFQGAVHALVILAHDDPAELEYPTGELRKTLAGIAETWVERGDRLEFEFPRKGRVTIEHFGFEDGISNPNLILQDVEKERLERGFDQWDGAAPLSLVLTAEPGHADRFGSFLVFRKLEQNVRAFREAMSQLAQQLSASGVDEERVGAMAVGRFRDGTPIIPTTAPGPDAKLNNFTFAAADPTGAVCPFHAHIRKTNPRGDSPIGLPGERTLRIARRGITYGARPDLASQCNLPFPESGIGLLFMSYQAKLDQFAIQQEGSDSNDFAQTGVGVDAVIGQNSSPVAQEWPAGSGQKFTMANFVKLLGGEYFFAPSMPFLCEISTIPKSVLSSS